jgi:hypothetical protein
LSERASAGDIERELRRIAEHMTTPTEFTLFGGCNLSVRGIKTTTKDTDLIVHSDDIATSLLCAREAGYDNPEDDWWSLDGNFAMTEREGGIMIDFFPPNRIFDGPGFTQTMRDARELWFEEGKLKVYKASINTTFLFKAITGRWRKTADRDIDDLRLLITRNLIDWESITVMWQEFKDLPGDVVATAQEAVAILRMEGLHVAWKP